MDYYRGKSEGSDNGRRRGRRIAPISTRRAACEWVAIALLLAAPAIGVYLFGAVRLWSICPLMFLSFVGAAICFARPLFVPELRKLQAPPGGWGLLLFLAYGIVMMSRSLVPYDSKIELVKIAGYVCAYWAWTDLASRQRRWRIILSVFIVAVTMIAWYAIIQHVQGSRMVLNLERPDVYGMRASGTYFCPNHFANLLELVLPVCLVLMLMPNGGFPLRLLAGYGLAVCLPVMYLTQSRSGWIGAIVGLSGAGMLVAMRRSRKAFLVMLVVLPLVMAILAGAIWWLSPMVRERISGISLSHPDAAVQARFMMWKDSLPMIRANPWFGYGPGTFVWAYPPFKSRDLHFLFNYTHNEYLHTMADYGLVGFAIIAAAAAWVVIRLLVLLRRVERDRDAYLIAGFLGCLAASFAHAFFDFNFHIFSNTHFLFLIGGVVMACLYTSGELKAREVSSGRAVAFWGAGVLAALLLAVLTAQIFFSYGFHFLGERDREALRLPEAERQFRRARRIDPGNWRPYLGMGHICQTRGFWDLDPDAKRRYAALAMEWYDEALRRNPVEPEAIFGKAKVYNTLGESEKALECLREVVRQNPRHLFYVSHLGLQLRRMGRYQEALDVFRDAQTRWSTGMIRINIEFLERKLAEQSAAAPAGD